MQRFRNVLRGSIPGAFLLLAGFCPSTSSHAADLTYNPGTVPVGGTAVWDTTTLNWLNGSAPTAWANTTGTNAIFTGTAVTVGVTSGGLNAGNLTFSSDGWTINGGNLTLASGAASTISVGSTYTETISAGLLNGFTKSGAGTLVLANTTSANTGNVTVGTGTLKMGAANQIADSATLTVNGGAAFDLAGFSDTFALSAGGTGTITNSASGASTLTFSNTAAFTYGGVLSGNLALADTTGSGGITLAGTVANTNTGLTTFNALVTNYLNNTGGNAVGGSVSLLGGGVTLLAANQIADAGTVTIDVSKATAVLNLNGYSETIGALNSTGTADTNAHVNLGSGTLTIAGSANSTFAGIITGTGSLLKTSGGNLTLTGANTFTGGVTVKSGTLVISSDANLGVSGSTYGPLTLDGGALNGGNNNVAINAARTVNVGAAGANFNPSSGYSITLPNALVNTGAGAGNFSKSGFGTVVTQATSGSPLGAGSISMNLGTLAFDPSGSGAAVSLTGANALAGSRLTYNIGSALAIAKGSETSVTLTLGNTSAPAGSVFNRGGAGTLLLQPSATANLGMTEKLVFNGGVNMTNNIIAPSVVVQDETSGATLRGDFLTDAGGTTGLKAATYTNTNFAGTPLASDIEAVTASTTLAASQQVYALKVGTGAATTLTVGAGNTLTVGSGTTGTQAGVILNGISGSPATISGGTLALGAAEGLFYVNSGGGLVSSAITGTGGMTVFGSGVLSLSGANTLTGTITVNAVTNGSVTLRAAAVNTLPSTAVLALNQGSIFDLAGYNQTISEVTGSGNTTLGTGTLTVGDGNTFAYSGVISGTGSLVKQGNGTMTISGSSTFTGGTTINAGTLQLANGSNRLFNTSSVVIASGAYLDLNNQSQTVDSLTGPGTVTNTGTTSTPILTVGNNNSTFSQDTVVTGQTNYVKAGSGVVTLISANTYTGTSAVTAGTLKVGIASALPSATALTVGSTTANSTAAATFDLNGYNVTIGGLSSGVTTGTKTVTSGVAGAVTLTVTNDAATTNADYTYAGIIQNGSGTVALTKSGTRTLTLTAADTYTGLTTVAGGTLGVTSNGSTTLGALSGTTGIVVNSGGTLLLGGSTAVTDRLNNAATVTIRGGGKLSTGGLNEGTAPTGTGGSGGLVGVGALTLTGTTSTSRATIDFGNTQTGSALVFSGLDAGGKGAYVSILGFTGGPNADNGVATNDRLLFTSDPGFTNVDLANWQFSSDTGATFGPGAQEIAYNGYFEIVPVPEPATWVWGVLLLAAGGVILRRRGAASS